MESSAGIGVEKLVLSRRDRKVVRRAESRARSSQWKKSWRSGQRAANLDGNDFLLESPDNEKVGYDGRRLLLSERHLVAFSRPCEDPGTNKLGDIQGLKRLFLRKIKEIFRDGVVFGLDVALKTKVDALKKEMDSVKVGGSIGDESARDEIRRLKGKIELVPQLAEEIRVSLKNAAYHSYRNIKKQRREVRRRFGVSSGFSKNGAKTRRRLRANLGMAEYIQVKTAFQDLNKLVRRSIARVKVF